MIQSGCTHRHAAKSIGLDPATIRYACRNDPAFADRVQRAQQQRDMLAVRRIHNAGEKSWRAAAWLLERAVPDEFSFRSKKGDLSTYRGKRQMKDFVTNIVNKVLLDCVESRKRSGLVRQASQAVDERLAEIEAQLRNS
jgi:hypothetical protein